jgi:hypothetical protein
VKHGTRYAPRVKTFFARLKAGADGAASPLPDDPVRRLAIGVIGAERGEESAGRAIERLFVTMFDWNEVRVSTPTEVRAATRLDDPEALESCRRLVTLLQVLYDRENDLTLRHLKQLNRRDARAYLDKLKCLTSFEIASVLLWSLGAHAIPVSDPLLYFLREQDLVHPNAERSEVQAFLERHIPAAEAATFCTLTRSLSGTKPKPKPEATGSARAPADRARRRRRPAKPRRRATQRAQRKTGS